MSVRSGAAASMPGMMDTILNLGLNDKNAEWMAEATENERATFDAYRRLIHMFGDVVMGVDHEYFEDAFAEIKEEYGAIDDTEVPAKGLRELVRRYKKIYQKHTKESFPQDPHKQLHLAIEAVFRSWNAPRAVRYREINHLHGLSGHGGDGSGHGLRESGRLLWNRGLLSPGIRPPGRTSSSGSSW